jgi:hypothetical protein
VRVASVALRMADVRIALSDGTRCTDTRPEGEESGWSGVTSGCGYQIPYVVTFALSGEPARFAVEAGVPASPDGTPGPRAEIFVTDLDGVRRLFIVPVAERLFAEGPPQ